MSSPSAATSVRDALRAAISELDVAGALLYADDACARSLASAVGLPALLSLGALDVHSLASPPPLAGPVRRAVVLCSAPLPQSYAHLRALVLSRGAAFAELDVVTSLTEAEHALAARREAGDAAETVAGDAAGTVAAECERKLGEWLREAASSSAASSPAATGPAAPRVRVLQVRLPLQACPVGESSLFLLPPCDARPLPMLPPQPADEADDAGLPPAAAASAAAEAAARSRTDLE
mmetsp:Transcript_37410/g.123922  ORF Transcript_37410/g.123922 Transcript_37410/m.123922 type:complete len:236 (+) Transcript_37410:62-769(+)